MIATHGDEKGLVLPFDLAPVQIVIVPIYKGENQGKVRPECEKVLKLLDGFRVKFDDSDKTPGFKYNEWEMKGVPIRLEIGERDIADESVMLVRRDTREKKKVKVKDLEREIQETGNSILETLLDRADGWFSKRMGRAKTLDDLKKTIEKGNGFVRVPFCSDELHAKECADAVKEACAANMRGSLFGSKEKPKGEKCVGCGKPATVYLYAARQY